MQFHKLCLLSSLLHYGHKNNNDTVTLKNMNVNTIFTNVHLRLNCLALTIVAAVKHF